MIQGNTSAAFTPDLPGSNEKAFSLFLIHSFRPFSYLGGGLPPAEIPPGSNASIKTPTAIPIAVRMEAITIPYSQNNI